MKRPLLIGIGASQSGSGKTFLAAAILRHYTGAENAEASEAAGRWGAIKYTKTAAGREIVADRRVLMTRGKDTWHMLTAGAAEVLWLRTDRAGLPGLIPQALRRLSSVDTIVIEGNSAIEFSKPDIVIFIFGSGKTGWKPGIGNLAAGADIILADSDTGLPEGLGPKRRFPRDLSGAAKTDFFDYLTGIMDERRAETGNDDKGG